MTSDLLGVAVPFCARFLLLSSYGLLPGAAILVFIRFRFVHALDAVLACTGVSLAWTVFCVYALLFAGIYNRATAFLIVLAPAGWLAWMVVKKGYRFSDARIAAKPALRTSAIDRLVIFGVATFLILFFIDAATSPITAWDGNITWDKWAADWGRRQNLYGYLVGGYPQMLPMFSSVLYKLTGAYQQPIPVDQFVLHAMEAIFAFLLLAGIVRLTRLLTLPAWPAILLTFGNLRLRAVAMNVSADLLLVMITVVALALYVSYVRGEWESRYGMAAVLAPVLFGACFTKANGGLSLLFPLSFYLLHRRLLLERCQVKWVPGRVVAATCLLPLIACAPFYLYQTAASRTPAAQLNPHEVNFSGTTMLSALERTTATSYEDAGFAARIREASRRLLNSFGNAPDWLLPVVILPAILIAASLRRRLLVPLVFPLLAILLVWFQFASYDVRNALPALPIAAILATAGGLEVQRLAGPNRSVRAIFAACWMLAAAPVGWSILQGGAKIVDLFRADVAQPDHRSAFDRRLEAMRSDTDARVKMYFPREWPTYSRLKSLPAISAATNIIATSHLYRWFPTGAYPLSEWSRRWIRPGDFFIGVAPYRPPNYETWSMLYDSDEFRIWFKDINPRPIPLTQLLVIGATAPKVRVSTPTFLEVGLDGAQGLVVYNVPDRDLKRGSYVVWRTLAEADALSPGVNSGFFVYDSDVVDLTRTSVVADVQRIDENLVVYSGILTLSGKPLSQNMYDGILVGVVSSANNATLRLRDFRVSVYR